MFDQLSAEIPARLIKGFPTTTTTTTTTRTTTPKQNVDPAVHFVYSRVKTLQNELDKDFHFFILACRRIYFLKYLYICRKGVFFDCQSIFLQFQFLEEGWVVVTQEEQAKDCWAKLLGY
jgi:hypothetical protein